eukprot:CAMPEP_0180532696 /NCGR_PEP_ID=MMETSP1036_2-20121128/63202_1 /TAXON_ID=632150 /ORGANISM="Azadinium spinosum, Strain 3D9" /LENGTH=51 /DNA_ID=CAMNT_0022546805 /DNA_START=85 /DNA_END=240 /DNA_ORIENTATION=+
MKATARDMFLEVLNFTTCVDANWIIPLVASEKVELMLAHADSHKGQPVYIP